MRHFFSAVALMLFCFGLLFGQANNPTPTETSALLSSAIPLTVQSGTPLPVVLDKEVRIRKVGQPIHGKIAEPIYAFDKLVIPAGSEVSGSVSRIGDISAPQRALAAL